jgi:plasmid maintenance system antidote protein VapI
MRSRSHRPAKVSDQLRRAIEADGRSLYRIAEEADVSRGVLSRFLTGKSGLTTDTIDRLAPVLRLRVVASL